MLKIDSEKTFKLAIEKSIEFCKVENYEVAEVILRQLLVCDPLNQEGLQILGSIRHKLGDYQESLELFSKLASIDDKNPDYHNDLALSLSCQGDLNGAIGHLSEALDLTPMDDKPKRALYLSNMSVQLRRAGLYAEAETAIENAVAYSEEKDLSILRNYAALLNDTLQVDKSLAVYDKITAIKDDPEIQVDRAYALHLKGCHHEANRAYEHRINVFPQFGVLFQHYNPEKLWKKERLDGKTIIVYCEQGLGDSIQFVRYIPYLKNRFGEDSKVILHCNPSVVSLFAHSGLGIDDYFTGSPGDPAMGLPDHDYHVSLMSLPYLTEVDILHSDKYLQANLSLIPSDKLKVGICWAGSPKHPNDVRRSVYLKQFAAISHIPGIQLYSFQKDKRARAYKYGGCPVDLAIESENVEYIDLSESLNDLDEAGTNLLAMDLFITVDTALMHLAGALGLETWGLIPYVPDWRWGLNSESTPWYPTLKLFRQPKHGDWKSVFERIEADLKDRITK